MVQVSAHRLSPVNHHLFSLLLAPKCPPETVAPCPPGEHSRVADSESRTASARLTLGTGPPCCAQPVMGTWLPQDH